MQINKIEYQANDENEVVSILFKVIISNEEDLELLHDVLETYSNEYNLLPEDFDIEDDVETTISLV